MSVPAFDPEAVIDAVAPLLGLDIRPEYRAAVAANLRIAAGMAAQVLEVPMSDHDEPAAFFVPVDGRGSNVASPPDLATASEAST